MKNQYVDQIKDGTQVKILDFTVNVSDNKKIHLGINIQKIKEIIEKQTLQPVPESYFPYIGICNLRNVPIPIINLNYFFNQKKELLNDDYSRIMICEFQKILIGFTIDKTGRISTVKNSLIQPVPEAMNLGDKRLFNGLLKQDSLFINLLDIEWILDSLKIKIAQSNFEEPQSQKFSHKKVLLVEDSKLFQEKLKSFFNKLGVKLTVANDGVEGLQKLEQHNYDFDIIFTDIEMPRLNGLGMVREVKKHQLGSKIPVIFNTSISNQGLVEDIKKDQLGDYFIKYNEDEIYDTLKSILEAA